jgi:C4-dicarboxylate transporter/malic acid transport protein
MTTLLARPDIRTRTLGPNWFAAVMGTGIVAVAAATVPVRIPGLRPIATAIWALAAGLLVVLIAAWSRHLRGESFRRYAGDPVMAPFWGAPPMALLTVGAGTLLYGPGWLGERAAVDLDLLLWTVGTLLGLVVAVAVPYLMITRHRVEADAAFGGWLMPVVPPMVSAATGALLVPHVGDRADLLLACWAMFGISMFAAFIVITQIWSRLVLHPLPAARLVPTVWIVLGPLGQSVTAVHLLGRAQGGLADQIALLYGVPVAGFALFWLALAAALTVRTARAGLPFTLTWWSFTFPVGTVVTGMNGLAARTGSPVVETLAVLLYAFLVAAWLVVALRTLRGFRRLTR